MSILYWKNYLLDQFRGNKNNTVLYNIFTEVTKAKIRDIVKTILNYEEII